MCEGKNPEISIVVPLYNEEENILFLKESLDGLIKNSKVKMEVVLVDDGSMDNTSSIIQQIALTDDNYQVVLLSRNFGHQIALTAGIKSANATQAIFIIDGDLQDPPELFSLFYKHFQEGYDIVYAVREKRKENIFKKISYSFFYRLLKSIANIDMPLDSGDFSLISRKVADIINKMPEESRFIRGMRAWVGFNQIGVPYERDKRLKGKSKYTSRKLLDLAYNGIFNFSEFPIKFIVRLGLITISASLIYLIYSIYLKITFHTVPVGFTALLTTIILFSGVQLVALGIIGGYVVRIFFQVKKRPLYVVKRRILNKEIVEVPVELY